MGLGVHGTSTCECTCHKTWGRKETLQENWMNTKPLHVYPKSSSSLFNGADSQVSEPRIFATDACLPCRQCTVSSTKQHFLWHQHQIPGDLNVATTSGQQQLEDPFQLSTTDCVNCSGGGEGFLQFSCFLLLETV